MKYLLAGNVLISPAPAAYSRSYLIYKKMVSSLCFELPVCNLYLIKMISRRLFFPVERGLKEKNRIQKSWRRADNVFVSNFSVLVVLFQAARLSTSRVFFYPSQNMHRLVLVVKQTVSLFRTQRNNLSLSNLIVWAIKIYTSKSRICADWFQ